MPKSKTNRTRKLRSSIDFHEDVCCEYTFHSMQNWYIHLFEKLGWMILAKTRGMNDKISLYKTSLNRFKDAVDHKLKHTKDNDRRHDLKVMHHNICILIEHVNQDFP